MANNHVIVLFILAFSASTLVLSQVLIEKREINIGVTAPINGSAFQSTGRQIVEGIEWFEEWMKDNPIRFNKLGTDGVNRTVELSFKFIIKDDQYTVSVVRSLMEGFIADPSISFVFSPFGLTRAREAAEVTEADDWMLLSYTNGDVTLPLNNRRVLPVLTGDDKDFTVVMPTLRVAGAKSTMIFLDKSRIENGERCANPNFLDFMQRHGFEFKGYISMPDQSGWINSNETARIEMRKAAIDMSIKDPDVWMYCDTSTNDANWFLDLYRSIDYTPRAYIGRVGPATSYGFDLDDDMLNYRMGVSAFEHEMDYPRTEELGLLSEVSKEFEARFGEPLTSTQLNPIIGALVLKRAVEDVSQSFNLDIDVNGRLMLEGTNGSCNNGITVEDNGFLSLQDEVYRAGFRSKHDTIVGRISWGAQGEQQREKVLMQFVNGERVTIAPLAVQEQAVVYPMPTWSERVLNPEFGHWTEYFVAILAVIFIISSIFWGVYMFVATTFGLSENLKKVFIAASPAFMYLILFGSIVIYASVFTFFPNVVNDVTCTLRPWLVDIGFILLFAPFFAKTLRIERMWKRDVDKIKISNLEVLSWVGGLLALHVVVLIIMTVWGDPGKQVVVIDPYRISYNHYECHYNSLFNALVYAIIAVNGVLLLIGAVIAFRVRNIPLQRYNESKIIFFAIYNVIFFAIICVAIYAPEMNRFTKFALFTIFLMLGAALAINALFIVKCQWFYGGAKMPTFNTQHSASATEPQSGVDLTATQKTATTVDNEF
mmetsp:Transcript_4302/g.4718  ORF Transcript_4302/g.4718 Transcript_4302/m.4718 type:complete len:767 (+) Transcript_4302:51-2351(+)